MPLSSSAPRAAGSILELGAGHGRDVMHFAREGFTVHATDFSTTGLDQLRAQAAHEGLSEPVHTTVHFFSRTLVDELADGWQLREVHPFNEGELPRRLWRITQTVPR